MSTNSKDKQRKLNATPLSKLSDSPERLLRRKRHRSRRSPTKLTKEEIQYEHFIHDLQKTINIYMKECLRESRFDTRDNHYSNINPSYSFLRATLKSKQTNSTSVSYRTNEGGTIISSISNRQDPLSFLKYNESKRLTADIQTILNGPAIKDFYSQFIRPLPPHHQSPIPMDESFVKVSDY